MRTTKERRDVLRAQWDEGGGSMAHVLLDDLDEALALLERWVRITGGETAVHHDTAAFLGAPSTPQPLPAAPAVEGPAVCEPWCGTYAGCVDRAWCYRRDKAGACWCREACAEAGHPVNPRSTPPAETGRRP